VVHVIAFAPWQALLDALGWVLAQIYELIPNYGVTIILLTVLIRLVLLPLGIKQIRSMQHMQLVQPKVKQIQQKYKQNKAKQQEEIMKLYKEYGVNPFSGCWPVLLQFPILIAMYSVLRWPQHPIHIPEDSELYSVVTEQIPQTMPDGTPITTQAQIKELDLPGPSGGTSFLTMNLLCQAGLPWQPAPETLSDRIAVDGEAVALTYPVHCAGDPVERVPYYLIVLLMFGTTYYQQRQMQKASPPGAASQQQQALLRLMPLMFGVFGIFFPAGLVVYWTTSNIWQIGQQYFMLRSRPTAEMLAARAAANDKSGKKGFMASMTERAEQERRRREQASGKRPGTSRKPGRSTPGGGPASGGRGRSAKDQRKGRSSGPAPGDRPAPPGASGEGGTGDDGGGDTGDRPER
jgi:YidC/Oxa1 family membrane protein insertase